ncbi:hypothetical protein D3C84_1018190 [compost metagenome]
MAELNQLRGRVASNRWLPEYTGWVESPATIRSGRVRCRVSSTLRWPFQASGHWASSCSRTAAARCEPALSALNAAPCPRASASAFIAMPASLRMATSAG